ncbi:MAG: glycosyltransferase family 4 protein [Chloroflexota bacterium]
MPAYSDIHLTLFLSRATPLARWSQIGTIDRELASYAHLSEVLGKLSIVTVGGDEERQHIDGLADNADILVNRRGIRPNLHSLLAPIIHRSPLKQATVYKTNQLDGSWTALIAGRLYRKPVVVRLGYPWARNVRGEGIRGVKVKLIELLESFVLKNADTIVVTTAELKLYLCEQYRLDADTVNIIPNYVDTDKFAPQSSTAQKTAQNPRGICFVGRLNVVKNLDLLCQAIAEIPDASLTLVGDGDERASLEQWVKEHGLEEWIHFKGIVNNSLLPEIINEHAVFILPSRFEGHPKALIEAMACGAAVVGTNVNGIRNLIQHEQTGLLCEPTVEGIRNALQRLLDDEALRLRLGNAARDFAVAEYSLDRIVQIELALLAQVQQTYAQKS